MPYPLGPVMLDIAGLQLSDIEKEVLRHPQVGGVILFGRNFESPEQLTELTLQIRHCREHLLIAVDHEGGRVQRFKQGFTPIPSMYSLAQNSPELLGPAAQLIALELMAVGIDFTFAPVLDRYNSNSQVIGDRAFDDDVGRLTDLASQFIAGLSLEGMAAVGKHFPGHGGVDGDTHTESAVDGRTWREIAASDLKPFVSLSSKLSGIMPAHVTFPEVCNKPVGFSHHWLRAVLREQMGYRGVVFSDDLSMAAARVVGPPLDRGQAALNAGCDMVLLCNDPESAIALLEGLESQNERIQDDGHLLGLSARCRRKQQGFSWPALLKTPFWQEYHNKIGALCC